MCIYIRRGADKSLARPNSRCRSTELIVSLERGVCSCAELQVLLVTGAERKHVRRGARFQQHRDASCHQEVPPPSKARRRNVAIFRPTRRSLLIRRPGWTDNFPNFYLSGLQKLEQRAKKCTELRGEYVE